MSGYRLAVDIGGTFTDVVLETPNGTATGKVLTVGEAPERGVVDGVRKVLDDTNVKAENIDLVIHGTTLATNAIIERRGARTALVATAGFRDTLEFAFGHRFDQYDLRMVRTPPLVPRPLRFEVPERIDANGNVLLPLDEAAVVRLAEKLRDERIESVAIAFIHAYRNADHERRARSIIESACPDISISVSHEICPEIREYERTSTTTANAYIQPLMTNYLRNLVERFAEMGLEAPLLMIMSSGSLTAIDAAMRFPIRLVESGPAGGAILGKEVAAQLGATQSIALDMGGTTAKIILLNDYEPRHSRSMEVARAQRFLPGSGLPLRIPVIDLIEIGAGGGSIAHLDTLGRVNVGPASAGSSPGPACYALGGEKPTVTDADLLLGKLDPAAFAGGRMTLDTERARQAVDTHLAQAMAVDVATAAAGLIEIVDENMANATRVHATDHGDEIESRMLVATGGAAPLHAGRIAQKLGITKVVVPTGAGVGSAHGFLRAPVAYEAVHSHFMALSSFDADRVNAIFDTLRTEAERIVELASGYGEAAERCFADMRYRGQGHELNVEIPAHAFAAGDATLLADLFAEEYRKHFNRTIPNLGVEVMTWTLVLSRKAPAAPECRTVAASETRGSSPSTRQVFDPEAGAFVTAKVYRREALATGAHFEGPALIVEDQTTTYVPASFDGSVSTHGHLVLQRRG
ncbi:MAG TPA: hydantoinase/oxoprolinase family protein [Beijerinckiaceae bacterium]|jgi:N-methylhydantoinase A|nr:hydantoinase/oxoprolinase family protein [Beijerinckiaceae bacterium]